MVADRPAVATHLRRHHITYTVAPVCPQHWPTNSAEVKDRIKSTEVLIDRGFGKAEQKTEIINIQFKEPTKKYTRYIITVC